MSAMRTLRSEARHRPIRARQSAGSLYKPFPSELQIAWTTKSITRCALRQFLLIGRDQHLLGDG